jgi:hypothetical protein
MSLGPAGKGCSGASRYSGHTMVRLAAAAAAATVLRRKWQEPMMKPPPARQAARAHVFESNCDAQCFLASPMLRGVVPNHARSIYYEDARSIQCNPLDVKTRHVRLTAAARPSLLDSECG